jgi:hypothetical protein
VLLLQLQTFLIILLHNVPLQLTPVLPMPFRALLPPQLTPVLLLQLQTFLIILLQNVGESEVEKV